MKNSNPIKKFFTGGGIVALAFVAIFGITKGVQGSDKNYEVKHMTHYQDGIDRVELCESPAHNFQHTPVIGWIVGLIALVVVTVLLTKYANDNAPKWFMKNPNAFTGGLLLVVLVFLFVISNYTGTECKTRTEKSFQEAVKADTLAKYLNAQFK